jgi:hypothetical protein
LQPFVGERFDSEAFVKALGCIEKNPPIVLPGRNLDVIIPVNAIPKGYNWEDGRGPVELLSFENGVLKGRRDNRPIPGPPRREF